MRSRVPDKLATVELTAQTSGQNVAVASIADADALTSLTVNAAGGNVVMVELSVAVVTLKV